MYFLNNPIHITYRSDRTQNDLANPYTKSARTWRSPASLNLSNMFEIFWDSYNMAQQSPSCSPLSVSTALSPGLALCPVRLRPHWLDRRLQSRLWTWDRKKPYYRICIKRRKFRSKTSGNMDSWKSRGGKSQGGEGKKWEDQRKRERKKMQVREKVGKSWFTVFFQWFGAPEGRKETSLKRRVRSQLAKWEMKNCTPFWREAHL